MRVWQGVLRIGSGLVAALVLSAAIAMADTPRPLLVEGKSTVYQRVITRPGAELYSMPNGPEDRVYPAFQPLYVFERNGDWLSVGPSASRLPDGWVKTDTVLPWKHNIVGAFTNAAGRKRQLMFDTEDRLRAIMSNEALPQVQDRLLSEVSAGILDASEGVVAAEPQEYVNIQDNLYLMPILDFKQDLSPLNYDSLLLMQLASVPLHEKAAAPVAASAPKDDFDVGIVFVLDTTQSMGPYITRTEKALENVVSQIEGTDVGKLVNFGVVAFRDNVEAVPGLEYRTKELVPMKRRTDQTEVLNAITHAAQTATVSSPGFNEDSLAGVEDAIMNTDWDAGRRPDQRALHHPRHRCGAEGSARPERAVADRPGRAAHRRRGTADRGDDAASADAGRRRCQPCLRRRAVPHALAVRAEPVLLPDRRRIGGRARGDGDEARHRADRPRARRARRGDQAERG